MSVRIRAELRRGHILYWSPAWKMPLSLFSYFREAEKCLGHSQFLAAILCASAAVELILNKDRRTARHSGMKRLNGWASLNLQNLRVARMEGLPLQLLLDSAEDMTRGPRFVERRNKVAHGDVDQMIRGLSDYDPSAKREAVDQVAKSKRFVVEWFNTAPDVQDCFIQNYRWP